MTEQQRHFREMLAVVCETVGMDYAQVATSIGVNKRALFVWANNGIPSYKKTLIYKRLAKLCVEHGRSKAV